MKAAQDQTALRNPNKLPPNSPKPPGADIAPHPRIPCRPRSTIHAGDIFQIVPSQRFETEYTGAPLTLYRTLRDVNPSPSMFCIKFGADFALVGSSPEVHVRATHGHVQIRPIAGTKGRGATPEKDEANAAQLLADPKDRAEHLMRVDLARNDVGRIAKFGTVRVTDFMNFER